jgi:hypothetical protein
MRDAIHPPPTDILSKSANSRQPICLARQLEMDSLRVAAGELAAPVRSAGPGQVYWRNDELSGLLSLKARPMTLEICCPNCGRTLRIGEQHAGKQVRCPACQQICIAPGNDGFAVESAALPVPAASEQAHWHLRTPEGQTYGPISWGQILDWAAEGRISAECQLAEGPTGNWRAASEQLPQLAATAAKPAAVPVTTYPWTTAAPAPVPTAGLVTAGAMAPGTLAPSFIAPHRGGLILVLGLLGFLVNCPIFSLLAWVMGSRDLAEMTSGRMDRSGEGLTQAGRILGMILSVLWMLGGAVALVVILAAVVAGN